MESDAFISVVKLVIQVMAFVIGGVWVVSALRSQIATLTSEMKNLTGSIRELKSEIKALDNRHEEHERRLVRLEVQEEMADRARERRTHGYDTKTGT